MKQSYTDYLQSPAWKAKRDLHLDLAEHRCQICNCGGEVHVHHRTYERLGEQDEHRDLVVLCKSCHERHHGKYEPIVGDFYHFFLELCADITSIMGRIAQHSKDHGQPETEQLKTLESLHMELTNFALKLKNLLDKIEAMNG
jgi:hypothetical protein